VAPRRSEPIDVDGSGRASGVLAAGSGKLAAERFTGFFDN
jgi:hypothetical protein